jgi:hypothetical protein
MLTYAGQTASACFSVDLPSLSGVRAANGPNGAGMMRTYADVCGPNGTNSPHLALAFGANLGASGYCAGMMRTYADVCGPNGTNSPYADVCGLNGTNWPHLALAFGANLGASGYSLRARLTATQV